MTQNVTLKPHKTEAKNFKSDYSEKLHWRSVIF